jgi:hypothetical protein
MVFSFHYKSFKLKAGILHSIDLNLTNILLIANNNKHNDWQVIEFKQLGLITLLQQFCNSYSLYIFVQLN